MVTGGLSATDLGNAQVIGGYAKLFYQRVAQHYGRPHLERAWDWLSEPHVSEDIFGAMLGEAGVEVVFSVTIENRNIVSITTEDGREWRAKVFVDCSYEGDLLAQSGATYTRGRESAQTYGETLAGRSRFSATRLVRVPSDRMVIANAHNFVAVSSSSNS